MKKVLFICTHNSARSQMAEGLLRDIYGDRYESYSAGTIATSVNPFAIKVLAELGIDSSKHYSKTTDEYKGIVFDYVITVCDSAKEACPFFPGGKTVHKGFVDPSDIEGTDDEKIEAFRKSGNEIKAWIERSFSEEELVGKDSPKLVL